MSDPFSLETSGVLTSFIQVVAGMTPRPRRVGRKPGMYEVGELKKLDRFITDGLAAA